MDYTRIVLEGDERGRANISALAADGSGHGYRLAGPKFIEDTVRGVRAPKTFTVELGAEDVDELHSYLRIWDEIHLGDEPPEWAKLIEASDRYRQATTRCVRYRKYNLTASRLDEIDGQRAKARAVLANAAMELAIAMESPGGER